MSWNLFGRRGRDATPEVVTQGNTEPAPVDESVQQRCAIADAIESTMARITFDTQGCIQDANQCFLDAMGYRLDEIVGQHHRMFCEERYAASPEYGIFWEELGFGVQHTAEFKRFAKGGRPIWIQATYSPMRDGEGRVVGVVKIAADITERKNSDLDRSAILKAVDQTQAMIEFEPDGTIRSANQGFLNAVGYSLDEIVGKHHRIFMPDGVAHDPTYEQFWRDLGAGVAQQGEFERKRRDGQPIFIQATYTPVLDEDGRVDRVIKFATDTTAQVLARRATKTAESIAQSISELASAASEINERVGDSATRSRELAERAAGVQEQVGELDNSSGEINHVVDFIRDLSDQINLLALNATIEAARAGEAGRGFHVVATEVKQLASATAEALERIGKQIDRIQNQIGTVSGAVDGIASNSSQVGENNLNIAAAIEEQTTIISGLRDNAHKLLNRD